MLIRRRVRGLKRFTDSSRLTLRARLQQYSVMILDADREFLLKYRIILLSQILGRH
jgi:hypothetical protein